jgi:hypothetical protein
MAAVEAAVQFVQLPIQVDHVAVHAGRVEADRF